MDSVVLNKSFLCSCRAAGTVHGASICLQIQIKVKEHSGGQTPISITQGLLKETKQPNKYTQTTEAMRMTLSDGQSTWQQMTEQLCSFAVLSWIPLIEEGCTAVALSLRLHRPYVYS